MQYWQRVIVASLMCLSIASCSSSKNYAPVTEVSGYEAVPASGKYKVIAGDTLYSIAWRYGRDYRVLAKNNRIQPPYEIKSGQTIYLNGMPPTQSAVKRKVISKTKKPVTRKTKQHNARALKEPNYKVSRWSWPAKGKVVNRFSRKSNGINIGGLYGASIYATAPGKVVYAGDGLRGYGNLIILKHNSLYLSAYAYNSRLFVKEGQWVKRGQKIAQMGKSASNIPMLHFEIRRAGKSVNPLKYLK